MKDKHVGLIAMLVAALGLAIAVIFMKVIPQVTKLAPQHIAVWRFTIAAPPLWAYFLFKRQPRRVIPDHTSWFLGLGVVFSIASFSAVFALQYLPSSIYVIIVNIYPSLVIVYTLLTGGSVPRLFWLGMPLALVGLFLTTFEFGAALSIDLMGLVITLVNALALVAYMLLSAKAFRHLEEPLTGSLGVMSGAMLTGILLAPLVALSSPDTFLGWVYLISFGIFGTLMPIVAMNISLKYSGAARGSVVVALQPVLTVLMAMIFLDELLTAQQWFGGGLVILSVLLMQHSPDRTGKAMAGRQGKWASLKGEKPIQ